MTKARKFNQTSTERSGGWRARARLLGATLVMALLGGVFMGTSPASADANLGGTITATDPDQNGRLQRNEVVATCAGAKTNPGFATGTPGTNFDYDAYAVSAAPGSCVTVTLSSPDQNLLVGAYSPHFNALDPTSNYLADPGFSTGVGGGARSFSFLAPPSGTFVLVVSNVSAGASGSYTLQVTGADVLGVVQPGTITAGDATQTGRLLRNTITSTCASPKVAPDLQGGVPGTFQQDAYAFSAPAGTCVSVALKAPTQNLFVVAYSSSFSPGDPSANYLADPGVSAGGSGGVVTFSFVAPASGSFVLVVSNTASGATGPYTLEVANATAGAPPADTTPPTCALSAIRRPGPSGRDEMDVTVQDTGSGLAAITNVQITNGSVATNPSPVPSGTTAPVVVTATKAVQGQPTSWSFDAVDVAGNVKHCA